MSKISNTKVNIYALKVKQNINRPIKTEFFCHTKKFWKNYPKRNEI